MHAGELTCSGHTWADNDPKIPLPMPMPAGPPESLPELHLLRHLLPDLPRQPPLVIGKLVPGPVSVRGPAATTHSGAASVAPIYVIIIHHLLSQGVQAIPEGPDRSRQTHRQVIWIRLPHKKKTAPPHTACAIMVVKITVIRHITTRGHNDQKAQNTEGRQ